MNDLMPCGLDDPRLQPPQVPAHGPTEQVQRHDRIDGQLAGSVQHTTAAPADPTDGQLLVLELIVAEPDVSARTGAADGDQVWMLAQQHDDPRFVHAAGFVHQAALQPQERIERHPPQQPKLGHGFADCVRSLQVGHDGGPNQVIRRRRDSTVAEPEATRQRGRMS